MEYYVTVFVNLRLFSELEKKGLQDEALPSHVNVSQTKASVTLGKE